MYTVDPTLLIWRHLVSMAPSAIVGMLVAWTLLRPSADSRSRGLMIAAGAGLAVVLLWPMAVHGITAASMLLSPSNLAYAVMRTVAMVAAAFVGASSPATRRRREVAAWAVLASAFLPQLLVMGAETDLGTFGRVTVGVLKTAAWTCAFAMIFRWATEGAAAFLYRRNGAS